MLKGAPPTEFTLQGECGKLTGDEFSVFPGHLKQMSFADWLSVVLIDNKVFYVAPTGTVVRVHLFDNGADYFSEDLARTIARSKFGFIDRKLNIVVRSAYDFAFPFEGSVASVCNGCRKVSLGEHRSVEGGKWGGQSTDWEPS